MAGFTVENSGVTIPSDRDEVITDEAMVTG